MTLCETMHNDQVTLQFIYNNFFFFKFKVKRKFKVNVGVRI